MTYSAREAALISGVDIAVCAAVYFLFGLAFFDTFGIILLLEGAALMLVGGAVGFAGQPGIIALSRFGAGIFNRKKEEARGGNVKGAMKTDAQSTKENDVRAAFYMLAGVLLFLESMTLAFTVR